MSMQLTEEHLRLGKRIRVLALVQCAVLVAMALLGLILYADQIDAASYLIALPTGLATLAMYLLRHRAIVVPVVYANILLWLLGIAALDPLSGFISGATWNLFQIWPPIATLILRHRWTAFLVAIITICVMAGQAVLIAVQIIPIMIVVPLSSFWFNLALQIFIILVLATVLSVISGAETRALQMAIHARMQLQTQLDQVRSLLHEKDQLNVRLARSLDDLRLRGEQLAQEQRERRDLTRTVQLLAAPVVPVLNGVVIVQMIGSFDGERLERLRSDLLNGIIRESARVAVLDTTGIDVVDTEVARGLLQLADAVRLLGARMVVVGLRPELAQTIIGLGLDLSTLETRADLQEGVRFAIKLAH